MELKLARYVGAYREIYLLIVPYGIETTIRIRAVKINILLIVPYGIETRDKLKVTTSVNELLIVPYGIETKFCASSVLSANAFNRTLWN